MRTIEAADLFCGAGGSSGGLYDACAMLGLKPRLRAVNHWPLAVETHRANHPDAEHFCMRLDDARAHPTQLVKGGHLDILIASPECTNHSFARGGMPMSDQSRASAWHILHWAELLDIENILVENVREYTLWGPLRRGKPIKARRGETFDAWVNALRSLGYQIDWRILNCADYGDPTTRRRFFLMARKGRHTIQWPKPTHANPESAPGILPPWIPARQIIDWAQKGEFISRRKNPLAVNTMQKLLHGFEKISLPDFFERGRQCGLCEPFVFVVNHGGHKGRAQRIDKPMPTLTAKNGFALCEPYIIKFYGTGGAKSVQMPLDTITSQGQHLGLVEPYIIKFYGTGTAKSVRETLGTITTKDRFGLVQPQISRGEGTVLEVDFRFRMFQPWELAAAMSFPSNYVFAGTRQDQIKQIGNAVPRRTAGALCRVLLPGGTKQ